MTTKLEKSVRREVKIDGEPWVVTISPSGLKLTRRGRRKGIELDWKGLVSGDAALAASLNASMRPPLRRATPEPDEVRSKGRSKRERALR
jgi:hypothetical protein